MRTAIKLIGMLVILCISMSLLAQNVRGQAEGYVPVSRLDIPVNVKNADVDPASNGTAVFTGTLYVDCQWPTVTEFETSCSAADWIVTISPASIGLPAGSQEADVSIIVKIPLETDADEAGTVYINGVTRTATPISYICRFSNQVTVIINKYYVLAVGSSVPYQEIRPHSKTTFNINVNNMGNAVINDLTVTIVNKDKLSGWTILLPATTMKLENGQIIDIPITLETPRDWTFWRDSAQEIVVKVTSQQTGKDYTYSVYVRQRGTYVPGFDPMFTLIALGAIAIMLKRRR